ncbi:MAG: arsenate reductase family protein [Clostridiales bacterium]|nr:arsenate reductase family protein [Clostridiales bacterium]
MKILFVEYPKCSTCRKAKKWLEDHGVDFEDRHIIEDNPTEEELKAWHEKSGLPLKRFFNTSGQVYRQNGIKDKLPGMTEEEQYALLATDGMLVKRPIIVADDFILAGFKEKEYEERLGK